MSHSDIRCYETRRALTQQLKNTWELLSWPRLPARDSDLNEPACNLMEQDALVAGLLQRLIANESIPEEFQHILAVDDALTYALAQATDKRKDKFLSYKLGLDQCIRIALLVMNLDCEKQ